MPLNVVFFEASKLGSTKTLLLKHYYRSYSCESIFRESFCESREGVRLPEKGADLRGSPGNLRGSLGNFRGSLGNFRGTPGLLLSSTVRELPGKSPKDFRGSLGNFRGSPGTFQKLGGAGSPTPSQRLAKCVSKPKSEGCLNRSFPGVKKGG